MKNIAYFFIIFIVIIIEGCSESAPPVIQSKIADPGEHLIYFHDYLKYAVDNWEKELGIDFHVVVINKKINDIVSEGKKIFQTHNIGKKAKTGGVLILLNPLSSEARIVVSHNLETVLTDAIVGSIAKSQLAPYASYNMSGMAVMDTMHFLKDHLLAQVAAGKFQLDNYYREKPGNKTILGFYSGGGGGSTTIPGIDFNNNWREKPADSELVKYLPGNTPLESVNAYANSLRNMIGYPDLPLFSESSRIMKGTYPFAPYEAYLTYLRIEKSRPLSIVVNGDHAVAVSQNPAHGFMPIMLEYAEGEWFVDYSAMIKNMFFDNVGNYYQKNSNNPYSYALKRAGRTRYYDIAAIQLPSSQTLKQILADLKDQKMDGMSLFLIAELLFRNAFAAMESLEYYEKTVALEPGNDFYRKKLIERYRYLGMENLALRHTKEVKEYKKRFDSPLKVIFIPAQPTIHLGKPTKVGDFVVYDHSDFSVRITNQHFSPMHIKKVLFTSIGDSDVSGLGDIINYWQWPDSQTLKVGQTNAFRKTWGFTVDTANTKMTYKFKFVYTLGDDPKEHVFIKELVLIPVEN